MKNTWKSRPLGELCGLINGRAFKPSDWSTTGVPIVRIQNLNDAAKPFNHYEGSVADRHRIDDGNVLLSWSGTPGTSFGCFVWSRGPAVLNQHIFKVLVDPCLMLDEFFVHAVNSRLDEMISQAHGGVGLRHITKGKLESIMLPVPPLDEQRRIVGRITECMERIDEIRTLRAEGLKEAEATPPALIEDLLSQCGGKDTTLGDVCRIESTLVDPKEARYQRLLHVGGANIAAGTGVLTNLQTAKAENLISGKHLFTDEDVLYSKIRPYLRKVARPDCPGLCSADIYPLRPKISILSRNYLFMLLLSRDFTDYAKSVSNRAGMPKVNRRDLFAYSFKLPEISEQEAVADVLDSAFSGALELYASLSETQKEAALAQDAVLRKAFAGEL